MLYFFSIFSIRLEESNSLISEQFLISDLIEAGYDIQYTGMNRSDVTKKTGEKEEKIIYTDLCYDHDFTEAELHMIIKLFKLNGRLFFTKKSFSLYWIYSQKRA